MNGRCCVDIEFDGERYRCNIQARTDPREPMDIDDTTWHAHPREAVAYAGRELLRLAERFGA